MAWCHGLPLKKLNKADLVVAIAEFPACQQQKRGAPNVAQRFEETNKLLWQVDNTGPVPFWQGQWLIQTGIETYATYTCRTSTALPLESLQSVWFNGMGIHKITWQLYQFYFKKICTGMDRNCGINISWPRSCWTDRIYEWSAELVKLAKLNWYLRCDTFRGWGTIYSRMQYIPWGKDVYMVLCT